MSLHTVAMHAGTPPDTASWYRDRYRIYNKDIDFREEFRFSSLLTMIQETAWNHAKELEVDYSQEAFSSVFWVLSRMRIEIFDKTPRWMEDASVATSPTGMDKLFAFRDFMAVDARERPFARATSSWVIIDSATRKLQRPQAFIGHRSEAFAASILPRPAAKLRESGNYVWGPVMTAEYDDIDSHRHVNNVRYAEWCLRTIEASFFDRYVLASFEVNFVAELSWGDRLRVGGEWSATAGKQYFKIEKADSGETAALIEFGWNERNHPHG